MDSCLRKRGVKAVRNNSLATKGKCVLSYNKQLTRFYIIVENNIEEREIFED